MAASVFGTHHSAQQALRTLSVLLVGGTVMGTAGSFEDSVVQCVATAKEVARKGWQMGLGHPLGPGFPGPSTRNSGSWSFLRELKEALE